MLLQFPEVAHRLVLVLEAEDGIIGVTHHGNVAPRRLPPLVCPLIEHIMQVRLLSSGETTAPWGVPASVSDQTPSSITPAFSHFWIKRRILGSAIRFSMSWISFSFGMLSKKLFKSRSRIQFPRFRLIATYSASSAIC
jgi:hypothetical protein